MEVDEHTSPSNVEHVLTELSSQAATINKHEQILTEILHLKPLQSHHLSSYLKLLQSYQPSLKVPLSQVHQQDSYSPLRGMMGTQRGVEDTVYSYFPIAA